MLNLNNQQFRVKILSLLLFSISSFAVAADKINNAIYIKIDSNHLISLNATEKPLENILKELCRQTNIELNINGKLTQTTTLRIKKQPIAQVIKKLLNNQSLVMIHSQHKVPVHIEKIIVYPSPGHNLEAFRENPLRTEFLAIDALLDLPEDEAISALSDVLSDRELHTQVIQHAIESLSLLPENMIPNALATGLGDPRSSIRADIIEALAESHNPESARIIAQTLFADKDIKMRQLAIRKLATFNSPASKAFLQAAMQDSDENVRLEAEYALDSFINAAD